MSQGFLSNLSRFVDPAHSCCLSPEPPVLKGEAHMSQTVVQGSSAVLDCPVHGDPSPVLRWLRNGDAVLRSLRVQTLHNGSLVIYSITVNISPLLCFSFLFYCISEHILFFDELF